MTRVLRFDSCPPAIPKLQQVPAPRRAIPPHPLWPLLGSGPQAQASEQCLEFAGWNIFYMVVSQNRGTQYRPQYTIVLIMGIPNMAPLIMGNPDIHIHIHHHHPHHLQSPLLRRLVASGPPFFPKQKQHVALLPLASATSSYLC